MFVRKRGYRLEVGDGRGAKTVRFLRFGFFLILLTITYNLQPTTFAEAATIGRPQNNLGLVGYWDFDVGKGGTIAYDRSGYGNDVMLTNMDKDSSWGNGVIGGALKYDGDNDLAQTAVGPAALYSTDNTHSVVFWAKKNSASQTDFRFIFIGASGSHGYVVANGNLYCANHQLKISKLGVVDLCAGYFPQDTEWHHVAVVWSSTGNTVYIDGAVSGTNGNTSNFISGSNAFQIGGTYENYYNGWMDDVRIYNRALSASEVSRLYKLGIQGGQKFKTVSESGLVGHWDFDDGQGTVAQDKSGQNSNGSLTNFDGSGDWVNGKINTAVSFDGTNDHVQVDDDFGDPNTLTMTAWFKTSASSDMGILGQSDQQPPTSPTSNTPTVMIQQSGHMHVEFWTGSIVNMESTDTYNDGEWHHVAFVGDGTIQTLYMDGEYVTSRSGVIDNSWWVYTQIGAGWCTGASSNRCDSAVNTWTYFNGDIDDVRIYNRALSAEEVQTLYELEAPPKVNSSFTNRITDGLVGHWTFDGGVTNTSDTSDVSGNGNNGSMNGDPQLVIGKLGQALEFNETTGQYVGLTTNNFPSGNEDRSVSLWFKTDNVGNEFLFSYGTVDLYQAFYVATYLLGSGCQGTNSSTGGNYAVLSGIYGTNTNVCDNVVANDGRWHHVVSMYDGTNITLFVDGELRSVGNPAGTTNTVISDAMIGKAIQDAESAVATIDDVRLYNRVLSADEVGQLYNMGR